MKITVLGAGSWGTTVASLVARRHPTIIWARDPAVADEIRLNRRNPKYLSEYTLPARLDATDDLSKAVGQAELLIVGVPSHAFRDTLRAARPFVHPWIPVVSLTKGLEQGTLLRMTQLIKEELPGHPAAALTGPNIAREIMEGNAAASVIATEDLAVAAALQRTLQSGLLRIYTNDDVIGCELGGALKNVVAIASGIAEGLEVGDNTRAAVMTRGLAEFTRLGVAMGGEPSTLAGLAGMGDLIATCISPHSRNRTVGEKLGRGLFARGGPRRDDDGGRRGEGRDHGARSRRSPRSRTARLRSDLRRGHRRDRCGRRVPRSPPTGRRVRPRLIRTRTRHRRLRRIQSLAGSGLASFNTSGVPSSAGTPSPGFVHSNSIVSSAST